MIKSIKNYIVLPDDLQNEIDLANNKVKVLRDQELELSKSIAVFKKENASLSIENDNLIKKMEKNSSDYILMEEKLNLINDNIVQESAKLIGLKDESQRMNKEADTLKSECDKKITTTQSYLEKKAKEEIDIDNKRKILANEELLFNNKKKQIIDMLNSML